MKEFQEHIIQLPLDFLKKSIINITESRQIFNYRQNYTNIFEKIWLLRHNSLVHTSHSVQPRKFRWPQQTPKSINFIISKSFNFKKPKDQFYLLYKTKSLKWWFRRDHFLERTLFCNWSSRYTNTHHVFL